MSDTVELDAEQVLAQLREARESAARANESAARAEASAARAAQALDDFRLEMRDLHANMRRSVEATQNGAGA